MSSHTSDDIHHLLHELCLGEIEAEKGVLIQDSAFLIIGIGTLNEDDEGTTMVSSACLSYPNIEGYVSDRELIEDAPLPLVVARHIQIHAHNAARTAMNAARVVREDDEEGTVQ